MKKIITSIIAVSMMAAISVPAFAADTPASNTVTDITDLGDLGNHDVEVKYDDSTNETIYSIDIVWGAMQFNYSAGTWDPATHSYKNDDNSAGFTPVEEGADKVTITNHTNKALKATVAYSAEATYNGITGTVTPADATEIATAVKTAVADAPSKEFKLELGGAPADQIADYTKVGTLTITLE